MTGTGIWDWGEMHGPVRKTLEGKENQNAYLTVCMALCLGVVLSLCLTLIDGVRRNGARMEVECVTEIGLQSIMAEYHRELMRQYNLFAIDTSYGTDRCSKTQTEEHLRSYLEKNLNYEDIFLSDYLYRDFLALSLEQAQLTKVSLMTDFDGAVFRRSAVDAVKADTGLGLLEEIRQWMGVIEVNGLEEGKEEEEKQRIDQEIDAYDGMRVQVEEEEWETLSIRNPTAALEEKRRLGILKLVLEDEGALSTGVLDLDSLVGNRMRRGQVNRGSMGMEEQTGMEGMVERFLFQEYLLRYMGHYGAENSRHALHYQVEYLIAGNESDVDNLRSVANRICAVREAANAIYLLSDEEKQTQIRLAAELVCTLVALPELTPLLEGAILLGWAFAESIYDVRSLLAGGRIPLLKDRESWHYSLSGALDGGLKEDTREGEGLSYEDYLRIFMMFTDKDTITARAMDMVEADIRKTPGNEAFRLDGCCTEMEAYITMGSRYGFQYEVTRQKSYY